MVIVGLDISLNSPGIVKANLDANLEIFNINWIGFTTVKKDKKKCSNLIFNDIDAHKNYINRSIFMRNHIMDFLCYNKTEHIHYAAFEDYPYGGASGHVFHIGGFTEIMKLNLYESGTALRWYDIVQIKKIATTRGNADKLSMYDAYLKIPVEQRIDITDLPPVTNAKGKSPTSDIIDAFYLMKLLQIELKLRRGLIQLKDMTEDMIWIFNRVTQTSKENILTREFVQL